MATMCGRLGEVSSDAAFTAMYPFAARRASDRTWCGRSHRERIACAKFPPRHRPLCCAELAGIAMRSPIVRRARESRTTTFPPCPNPNDRHTWDINRAASSWSATSFEKVSCAAPRRASPGLVEDGGLQFARRLKRRAVANQEAVLGRERRRNCHDERHGEAERVR